MSFAVVAGAIFERSRGGVGGERQRFHRRHLNPVDSCYANAERIIGYFFGANGF